MLWRHRVSQTPHGTIPATLGGHPSPQDVPVPDNVGEERKGGRKHHWLLQGQTPIWGQGPLILSDSHSLKPHVKVPSPQIFQSSRVLPESVFPHQTTA